MEIHAWTAIYQALRDIQSGEWEIDKSCGICTNVGDCLWGNYDEYAYEYGSVFTSWCEENFSRWPGFPVEGDPSSPVEGCSAEYTRHMDKWDGEYGERRKQLLQWMIEQFEAMPV